MAAFKKHKDLTDIHIIHCFCYADQTEREAAVGFVPEDIGKVAKQTDNNTWWVLVDDDPTTWKEITGGGGPSTDELVGVSANDTTPGYLDAKIVAGDNVTLNELNDGGDEDLEIAVNMDIDDLNDVNAPSPNDCEYLKYDNGTGKWIPGAIPSVAGGEIATVQACRTTDQNFTTSWVDVTFDSTPAESDPAIVEHNNTNTERIDIKESGYYLINYNVTVDVEENGQHWFRVRKNGTGNEIDCSLATLWEVSSEESDYWPVSNSFPTYLEAGDYITFQIKGPAGTSHIENSRINFSATRLRGPKGDQGDPGPVSVFGTEHQEEESDGTSSTTSTSFQNKLTLTTPSVPAGLYRVGFFYEWNGSHGGYDVRVEVRHESTVLAYNTKAPEDSDAYESVGGYKYVNLSGGVEDFHIKYRTQNSSGTARIRRARLELWRVS